MNILIIGNGGREHALAWKIAQSSKVDKLIVSPGNAGTELLAQNFAVHPTDVEGLVNLALEQQIDFTVVGPEVPLSLGIVNRFMDEGLLIFGPTRLAAQIETSKIFAKEIMVEKGVPTGSAEIFDDYEQSKKYVQSLRGPIVIKADGLAAGKGVVVAETCEQAFEALYRMLVKRDLGHAFNRVLIEEYLQGKEISVFGFVNGKRISSLVAACDYKRVGNSDTGPNTGGMGAYSPPDRSLWNIDTERKVNTEIIRPVLDALDERGTPYVGVLYVGLMITNSGPKVIEFNCRFGDPETQVVLPRLKNDLLEVMISTTIGDSFPEVLNWSPNACVGVVLTSGGYPDVYDVGHVINNLDVVGPTALVFHSGTKNSGTSVVSSGGRVLTVTAIGNNLEEARISAYEGVSRITFANKYSRSDIALVN